MTKYVHISLWKPEDAAGLHNGGVEVFAGYLHRAVPEMELLSLPDHPDWRELYDAMLVDQQSSHLRDWQVAEIFCDWAVKERVVDENTVVVYDGFWGRGLQGKVARTISVVHGTYWGRWLRHIQAPWGELVPADFVAAQLDMWNDERTEIVCCSEQCIHELQWAGVDYTRATLIHHGIDMEVYRPYGEPRVFMQAATSVRKGSDIIDQIIHFEGCPPLEFMNEHSGIPESKARRLSEAIALVAPTRHEGNAYVLLEAMACGVPLITYATGLAANEMDERCGVIVDDMAPVNYLRKMLEFDRSLYSPREWVRENAGYEQFAREWKEYLNA